MALRPPAEADASNGSRWNKKVPRPPRASCRARKAQNRCPALGVEKVGSLRVEGIQGYTDHGSPEHDGLLQDLSANALVQVLARAKLKLHLGKHICTRSGRTILLYALQHAKHPGQLSCTGSGE